MILFADVDRENLFLFCNAPAICICISTTHTEKKQQSLEKCYRHKQPTHQWTHKTRIFFKHKMQMLSFSPLMRCMVETKWVRHTQRETGTTLHRPCTFACINLLTWNGNCNGRISNSSTKRQIQYQSQYGENIQNTHTCTHKYTEIMHPIYSNNH